MADDSGRYGKKNVSHRPPIGAARNAGVVSPIMTDP